MQPSAWPCWICGMRLCTWPCWDMRLCLGHAALLGACGLSPGRVGLMLVMVGCVGSYRVFSSCSFLTWKLVKKVGYGDKGMRLRRFVVKLVAYGGWKSPRCSFISAATRCFLFCLVSV